MQNEKKYYSIKIVKNNAQLKLKKKEQPNKNIIIQKKKSDLIIPISKMGKKPKYFHPLNQNISNHIIRKDIPKKKLTNIMSGNTLNNNNISEIEERILLQRPKVKIKLHSSKHDNLYRHTISSEKNNNNITCKIHQVKLRKSKIDGMATVRTSIHNNNQINNYNYKVIKQKDKSHNYNLSMLNSFNTVQEKSLQILSNQLDNLIGAHKGLRTELSFHNKININDNISKDINNEPNMKCILNYNSKCKTNVYRRKLQRKINNLSNKVNFLDFDLRNNLDEKNKSNILEKKHHSFLPYDNQITNRTYKISSLKKSNQRQNNPEFTSKNIDSGSIMNNQNNLVSMTSSDFTQSIAKLNFNYLNSKFYDKDHQNIGSNNNLLIVNNKANTINFMEKYEPENNEEENTVANKKYLTLINNKYSYKNSYNTPKSNEPLVYSKNTEEETQSNENIKNYNYKKQYDNKNNGKNNPYITLYSNSSQFNTINTLNNSNNNILTSGCQKKIETKIKHKRNILIKNKNKYLNDICNHQRLFISSNNSKNRKLKHVITSIEGNRNNKNDKNIIVSEVGQNGKINNIRIKLMNNSIEKIMKQNYIEKKNNADIFTFPKKWNKKLTYIKKNQGTHFRSMKEYNTINNYFL